MCGGGETAELDQIYGGDTIDGKMARAAAQIEGRYYCTKTRVEETVLFIKEIGAKKVGIATCFGLINELRSLPKSCRKTELSMSVWCVR